MPLLAPGLGSVLEGQHGRGLCFLTATAIGGAAAVAAQHLTEIFPPAIWLLYVVWHGILVFVGGPGSVAPPARLSLRSRLLMVPFLLPPVCTVALLMSSVAVVEVSGSAGMPGVLPGEWVVGRLPSPDDVRPGSLVAVRCNDGATHQVGRLLALPEQRLRRRNGTIWRQSRRLPQEPIGYWSHAEQEYLAVAEVLGDDYYVVLVDPGAEPGPAAPEIRLGATELGVVPDNRGSEEFLACTGSPAVEARSIVAIPEHVLFSPRLSRLGLHLK
jgi:hypothetical protein